MKKTIDSQLKELYQLIFWIEKLKFSQFDLLWAIVDLKEI